MDCTNCGEPVDPRGGELGYDYCTRPECQEACVERVELAAVAVNKASAQYVRADEVVPDGPPARWGIDPEPAGEEGPVPRRPRQAPPARRRSSTTKRLQRGAPPLHSPPARPYQPFCKAQPPPAARRSPPN